MKIKGIDVSKYQGEIDWNAAAADGVRFAMVRAGYGMYSHQKDPRFDRNMQQAAAAGIPTGAYLYSYAKTPDEARREAELFLEWLKPHNLAYPAAFDIEDNSQIGLSSETLTQMTEVFCETIQAAGYIPMVYANKYWLQNKLIYDRISRFDIWLAHYVTATDYNRPHAMWQCSSRAGIAGINGNCDLNWCYKDYGATPQPPHTASGSPAEGVCTGDGVYVHYLPVAGKQAVLRQLNAGNQVAVFGQSGNWYIVRAGSHYGYVSADYIRTDGAAVPFAGAVCNGIGVRVRTQPDTADSSNIIRQLNCGNQVDIIDRLGDWFAIRAGEYIGYAAARYFNT